jgi:predicted nucleotidyltransferase
MTREEAVAKLVPRLIEHYNPIRIYLFGSTARGDYRDDSDLDFMVVLPDDAPQELFRSSHEIPKRDIPFEGQFHTWGDERFRSELPLRASFASTVVERREASL